jgi:hypothetical protein
MIQNAAFEGDQIEQSFYFAKPFLQFIKMNAYCRVPDGRQFRKIDVYWIHPAC